MHLAIDVREACATRPTGKGRWTHGFVTELLTRPIDLTLYTDRDLPDDWRGAVIGSKALRRVVRFGGGLRWHLRAARAATSKDIDAYVSPTSYIVPAIAGRGIRCIPIVHDLIAFRGEPHERRAAAIERLTLRRTVARAHRICTVSASTRADLVARYPWLDPSAITPIFAGPSDASPEPSVPDQHTILSIGTLCPRKNQERLIAAYAALPAKLRKKWRLVLAGGRGWDDEAIVRAAKETPGAAWLEYVPDKRLKELLSTATVFALPSLYEGFGLPILDAFQRGIPVLTSDRGSLKELAGGAAFIVDPEDVASIARGLEHLLTDPILRADLAGRGKARAGKYSWKDTVDRFLAALA